VLGGQVMTNVCTRKRGEESARGGGWEEVQERGDQTGGIIHTHATWERGGLILLWTQGKRKGDINQSSREGKKYFSKGFPL